MYCIDRDDEVQLEIYGIESNNNFRQLDVIAVPCNYLHGHLGYKGDSIHPECIADL